MTELRYSQHFTPAPVERGRPGKQADTPHHRQPVNDVRSAARDLERLTAERIDRCFAGIASHTPDSLPRKASGDMSPDEPAPPSWCNVTMHADGASWPCGELRPCHRHDEPNDYPLNAVEGAAIASHPTTAARERGELLARELRTAAARLVAWAKDTEARWPLTRERSERVEPCTGGWGEHIQPCNANAVTVVTRRGISVAVCQACLWRSDKADQRAKRRYTHEEGAA